MKYRFGSANTSLGIIVFEIDDQGTPGVESRSERLLTEAKINYDAGSFLGTYEVQNMDLEFTDDDGEIYDLLLSISNIENVLFNILDYSLQKLYEFKIVPSSIEHDPVQKITQFTAIDRLINEFKFYKVGELSPFNVLLVDILDDIFDYFGRTLNIGTYPTYTNSTTFGIGDIKFSGSSLSAVRAMRISEFFDMICAGFGSKLFQKDYQWYFKRLVQFGQTLPTTVLRGAKIYKINPEYHREIYATWNPGDVNVINTSLFPGKIGEIDCFETVKILNQVNEDVSDIVLQWHLYYDYYDIYCREDLEYLDGEVLGFITPDDMIYDSTLQRYFYPLKIENDLIGQKAKVEAVEAAL